ncbi:MAG: diguanylate cyclase [Rhodospirillales bacterium]|nr:diguanylate cyclase [Rhodospirillales bacterium]
MVEDDGSVARQLERDLTSFGFRVCVLDHPAQLRDAVSEMTPAAVILDVVFASGDWVGIDVIAALRGEGALDCPVVILSERDDLRARLASVRAGCDGYLVKPANIADVVDLLDRLTLATEDEAFRVLVVDDDAEVARHTEFILRVAGMITDVVDDPMDIVGPLDEFRPELILMDLHMPGCGGQELAAVIRQQVSYAAIPIVFLSDETNVERQLQALQRGGDDFLSKSLGPGELVLAVTTRARRFRLLRSMMMRDGLTGLLNHTNTKQQLEIEIDRARRADAPLAFIMVDIDHFKAVNDTYGHAAGDAVLKSLSRLMKERLRATDIVGRMGGEEFAAVLADTDAAGAHRIFDELRRAFAAMRYNAEGREFSVTMSCGVAQFPSYDDASRLSNAADKALYAAKHNGRNRVETAPTGVEDQAASR